MNNRSTALAEKRNLNLDLAKLISCFAVVGLHTLKPELSVLNKVLYYLCGFAVPIFIMSSGFIVLHKKEITLKYAVSKSLIILRIVVIWSFLIWVIQCIQNFRNGTISPSILLGFPKNIVKSLIQKGWLSHFWYLGAMILLYCIAILLHKMIKYNANTKDAQIKKTIMLWSIAAILSMMIQLTSYIAKEPIQKLVIQTFRLWSWVQYFLLGALMVYFIPKITEKLSLKIHIVLLSIISAVSCAWQVIAGIPILNDWRAEYFYDDGLFILWICLLFSLLIRIPLSERIKKQVSILSPLTMGVYIVHQLLIKGAEHFITINHPAQAVLLWCGILLLSFIVVYLIRKLPFGKYIISL